MIHKTFSNLLYYGDPLSLVDASCTEFKKISQNLFKRSISSPDSSNALKVIRPAEESTSCLCRISSCFKHSLNKIQNYLYLKELGENSGKLRRIPDKFFDYPHIGCRTH